MKKVLIVEDNKWEAEALKVTIEQIDAKARVFITDNAKDALWIASNQIINIFIVDIVLHPDVENDASGMDLVEALRGMKRYRMTPVVFMTALEEPRLHAFHNLHCYQYLKKPIFQGDCEQVCREVLEIAQQQEDDGILKLTTRKIIYAIPKKEILYAYSHAYKMHIITTKDTISQYYLSCATLLKELDSDDFWQCNRNTIVNCNRILYVDNKEKILRLNGVEQPIKCGDTYIREIQKRVYGN